MTVPRWMQACLADVAAPEAPSAGVRARRAGLRLASYAYGAAVAVRNAAYDAGVFRVHRLPARVLCVGNLTVGGTGKTPTVLALAAALRAGGRRPCILLRGYGGARSEPGAVGNGSAVLMDWRAAGDEAVLLARRASVPVVVGSDRLRAGEFALRRFDPDVILLDDGFQHRRLHRDVNLVLIDGTDPFGGEALLPRGRLREPLSALRRAHAVLVTRADQAEGRAELRARLASLAPALPIGFARHRATGLRDIASGAQHQPDALRGRRVLALSGIANPLGFERTVESLGGEIVSRLRYPDHHPFRAEDRERVEREAAAAEWIVTTEKDGVRLEGLVPRSPPVLALGVDLEVMEGGGELASVMGIRLPERADG